MPAPPPCSPAWRSAGGLQGDRHVDKNLPRSPAAPTCPRPGPYGKLPPSASCPATSPRPSTTPGAPAGLRARDAPPRPAPAADSRCTLRVPRSYRLVPAVGVPGRSQAGLSLGCPGHAGLGQRLMPGAGRADRRIFSLARLACWIGKLLADRPIRHCSPPTSSRSVTVIAPTSGNVPARRPHPRPAVCLPARPAQGRLGSPGGSAAASISPRPAPVDQYAGSWPQ
jgi:hypothetical protein